MAKNYIPSPDYLTSMYSNPQFDGRWIVVRKVPINKIQIDYSLFSFQNEINQRDVDWICKDFLIEAWYPIMVTPKSFLLDGQHRLAAAKKMGLKYIDVVIDNGNTPNVPCKNNRDIFNDKISTFTPITQNL